MMDKEYNNIDILLIDSDIKKKFEKEKINLQNIIKYKDQLISYKNNENLNLSIKILNDIEHSIKSYESKIEDISSDISKNFYMMESSELLERYKNILAKPIRVSFSGKKIENIEVIKEKEEIINKYLIIANKYNEKQIFFNINLKKKTNLVICDCCSSKNCFESLDGKTYICEDCGFQKEILGNLTSYKDVSRVNISSKYTYERRVHFRDCINQYQGKQNSTISEDVFKDLENQFESHGLLIGTKNDSKEIRFQNITKDHILLFLKETGHTKHYEDVFLIYFKMTGKKSNDISHLEDKLIKDFEVLSDLYDKKFKHDKSKKIDRKSFINVQYVLFQLLRRHKYPCKKDDFNMLKTLDRKSFHDEIVRELFEHLNFNFTPIF